MESNLLSNSSSSLPSSVSPGAPSNVSPNDSLNVSNRGAHQAGSPRSERIYEIAVVVAGVRAPDAMCMPWIHFRDELAACGFRILVFQDDNVAEAFTRRFDAMLLHVWQDWENPRRFYPRLILPIMHLYAGYGEKFSDTIQIILNHADTARRPYATPYWRQSDPILYRAPAYERSELLPFPADAIFPF